MSEILTIAEVAALLKVKPSAVYSMTRRRGQVRMEHPIKFFKINGAIRFLRRDLEVWIEKLATQERAA